MQAVTIVTARKLLACANVLGLERGEWFSGLA